MIQLERVSKVYGRPEGPVAALEEVDLQVRRGEFVAVCGPSGCGKTTLLSIVGALITPTSGRVAVAGEDLTAMTSSARAAFRASKVGFVFQMFHLLPYLSVLDNVRLAANDGRESSEATELLSRFGLGDRLSHRPPELSAGERQRVAIARAMMNRPDVILADEPTGNLDGQSATDVLELLTDFRARGGTVLLVTHQEQAAARADRVVLLRSGRVALSNGGSLEKPDLVR